IPERFREKLTDLERRIKADDEARAVLESRMNMKTASGYNLFAFLTDLSPGRRIAKLLAGSVGTLGLITRAVFQAEVHEREAAAVLLYFDGLAEAGRAVSSLRELDVAAIELISRETIRIMRDRTSLPGELAPDAHLLFVELAGPEVQKKVKSVINLFHHDGYRMSAAPAVVMSQDGIEGLWKLRKQILWLIEHPQPGLRALAVINDVGVPVDRLAEFIYDVQKVFARHGTLTLVYGHAGNGNLHLRPLFDLSLPDIRGRVRQLADDIYDVVFRHGGTVTAEHGMGRLRAPYLKREWGEALYNYMREVKRIFDPEEILNPGVMFSDAPITDHMREDLLEP
ncbi:MAG TPA: FAD-linked oxidase C-terminal domain-containing protein, partial [Nitrospirota bacterium]|nr:FAD-linked oxidase C-terminal domain-containing protein [Nitrospirota bacterium]